MRGIFPAGGGGMSNFFGKPRTLGATNLGASRLTHPYEYVLNTACYVLIAASCITLSKYFA